MKTAYQNVVISGICHIVIIVMKKCFCQNIQLLSLLLVR